MRALTLLNDRIIHCTACPRLVTYREAIAAEKRRQFEAGLTGGVRFLDSATLRPASTYSGSRQPPTAATEPDGSLQAIAAGTGCMTPYIDSASPIKPALTTGMMG